MVKQKKTAYWKNLWKSIFKSKARFLSIFSIVFLGAAFFAGLRNTPGTMMKTMDAYLDEYRFCDLTYLSTLGFSQDDINEVKDLKGISRIEYGYQFDALTMMNNKLSGVKVYTSETYNDEMLNQPILNDGKYPSKSDECLIDVEIAKAGTQIGDKIEISNDQGKKTFEVVGIVKDVRYVAKTDRGTNTLGDGTNLGYIEILNQDNAFFALPKDLYDLRDEKVLYNQISIAVDGASDYNLFSEEYDDYIENVNTKVKSALSLRLSDLYESLSADAKKKLDEAQTEYDKGFKTYSDSKTTFETQILEAKIQLTNAKMALAEKETDYLKAQSQANQQTKDMIGTIEETSQELKKDLEILKAQLEKYKDNPLTETPPEVQKILDDIASIRTLLDSTSSALDGFSKLNEADLQIQKAKLQIQQQENKLTLQELKTRNQLDQAKEKLNQADLQIQGAKEQVNQIPKGKLYTLTRHENAGLVNYDSNVDSISSIADIFPLMFFLVSALVSLTTMTRMVEEQRSQSGTLRALGYSKWDVIKQYIVYVIFATFFACVLGIVLGTQFFPRIIYYLYSLMLFQIDAPTFISSTYMIAFQTVFISVFVTMIATLSVCMSELNLMPAVLMRPKAPKLGKRIFLEKMDMIWKRLSFNQKVTMRNIFRYKKRFFMSVIGIAGCTALIITGFGIKYSVSEVVDRQYEKILNYDAQVRLEKEVSITDAKTYQENLLKRDEVSNVEYVLNQSVQVMKNKEDLYASMVVYQSMDNIQNFITFNDMKTNKKIALSDDGIVLSIKTAELLGVDVNDNIDIEISGTKYNVKVSGIMENYFMNYVYMSQTLYENLTSSHLKINHAFMTMKKMTQSNKTSLENYMQDHHYGNLSYIDSSGSEFDNQVQSLDIVIAILIICAGALNFIVLYNLTNINIQERKSEIATIKVLGFRRKEVYDYIFRENILLSVIGSLVGMIFGFALHQFIIRTVELDMTMFVRNLTLSSYVIAVFITLGFTMLINLTMRHVLNKVDMVESLKSIE